jgi:glycosyltransferase involved in cell wall biosynthesis
VVGEFVPQVHHRTADAHASRELFGLTQKKHVITMLGGIREIKGTLVFLRAAQQVLLKYSNVIFVIAGSNYHDGTSSKRAYFDVCMKVVESLRQEGSIILLGEIANALDLIGASDIIVSPSLQTHFSRPVIEAWAYSKPVVAAKTAHMSDLIAHGINGFLVEPGDAQTFADCLVRLLNDDELCKRLGREGKKKASAEFDADKNLQTIVETCDAYLHA